MDTTDRVPFWRANIPLRVLVVILILVFALFVIVVGNRPPYTPPWYVVETFNLRTYAYGFAHYVEDHEGTFPVHAKDLIDSGHLRTEEFTSRRDLYPVRSDLSDDIPEGWYQYDNFVFYPTADLTLDAVSDPSRFVLAYCPPYDEGREGRDHPTVFLDWNVELLSRHELFDLISQQHLLLNVETNEQATTVEPATR